MLAMLRASRPSRIVHLALALAWMTSANRTECPMHRVASSTAEGAHAAHTTIDGRPSHAAMGAESFTQHPHQGHAPSHAQHCRCVGACTAPTSHLPPKRVALPRTPIVSARATPLHAPDAILGAPSLQLRLPFPHAPPA